MPEDSASQKRRQRHFWKWVMGFKKITKDCLRSNVHQLNQLRAEHVKTFPNLYSKTKTFSVNESIKEFHRKVIKFNATLRESKDFKYCDEDSSRRLPRLTTEDSRRRLPQKTPETHCRRLPQKTPYTHRQRLPRSLM